MLCRSRIVWRGSRGMVAAMLWTCLLAFCGCGVFVAAQSASGDEVRASEFSDSASSVVDARDRVSGSLPLHRPLVVGGDNHYPPFEFLDDQGRPAGFNVELTRAIARVMNLDVGIRLDAWASVVRDLETGKVDVIQGMFYSEERDRTLEFTQPFLVSHHVSVVRGEDGPAPDRLSQLRGRKLGVQRGDVMHEFLIAQGIQEHLTAVENQEAVLRGVSLERFDVGLVRRVTALRILEDLGVENLRLGRESLLTGDYGYAVRDGERALLALFSEGLSVLKESGEYRTIYRKWFGMDPLPLVSVRDRLMPLVWVILPLMTLLLLMLLWSWSLRRQVARQTRQLHDSADRFRFVFESANVGKSITMPSGEVLANQAFADLLGYTAEELGGTRWQDFTLPEDMEWVEENLESLRNGSRDSVRFEKRYPRKDGTLVWADLNVAIRRGDAGQPLFFITTAVDITEKKRAEQALYQSEEFQRAMIACSPVALYTLDMEGRVVSWNASAERVFGWSAEEVLGQPLPIVPEASDRPFESLRDEVRRVGDSWGHELLRLRKDGTPIPISLSVAPVKNDRGEIVGIMGAAEDISRRKEAERRIQHLNQVLRSIREIDQLIVREKDPTRLIQQGCRILVDNRGYPSALIVLTDDKDQPRRWATAGRAADVEALEHRLAAGVLPPCCPEALQQGGLLLVHEREITCQNCPLAVLSQSSQSLCAALDHGSRRFGYLIALVDERLVLDEEELSLFHEMAGDFAYALFGMDRERERKQAEAALTQSESRFRLFAELAPVGIVISDDQQQIHYISPKFTEMFGYSRADIPTFQHWWSQACPEPDREHTAKNAWDDALNQARASHKEVGPLEIPVTRKDGNRMHVEFRLATTGTLNVVVFTDVTERKQNEREREQLQAQLAQSQKMESVGRLAGGVAHDYNNMLSVILGFTELALFKTPPGEPVYDHLQEILKATRRSADITGQLLAFARRQTIRPRVLDLNTTVEGMLNMLRRLMGEHIDLAWQPAQELWPVRMDPTQIHQILANLMVNARDAIETTGHITIATRKVPRGTQGFGQSDVDYVRLSVHDDGAGMDSDTVAKVFEPFFTTKEPGKGTGLGLATVYGIIKQNHGMVDVQSSPGQGTTFSIYLPRHPGELQETRAPEPQDVPEGHGETILVVEDEASILKLARNVLTDLGYHVLAAQTPQQALELAREHPEKVHVLVTDVIMPRMNGRELADQLTQHNGHLKVLYMSGHSSDVIAHQGVLNEDVHFMQKPFSTHDLAICVHQVLTS